MKKIQDKSIGYAVLKKLVMSLFRLCYREITILGSDNIPEKEEPVIFAPTHPNALMDALAVHLCYPESIVFMMRGDAFSNPKIASFFKFIKIMPVFRMREGYEKLGKNAQYFEWAIDTLNDGKALGLMPEGGQCDQRRMRPLLKGIFRIGFEAQKKYGENSGIKIIPVGLDYGDYNYTGKHLIINVGEPLQFADYYKKYEQNSPVALNEMRDELYWRMRKLIVHIDDKNNYERYYLAILLAVEQQVCEKKLNDSEEEKFFARKSMAECLPSMPKEGLSEEEMPEALIPFLDKADSYLQIEPDPDKAFVLAQPITKKEIIYSIVLSVIMIPSLILNGIPYFYIRKFTHKNFSDKGFVSSASFMMGFLLYPIYWLLLFVLFSFILSPLKSLLLFLMFAPSLALITLRVKYIYEDLVAKLLFKKKYKNFKTK
jgi:1-acyl-sn-glycerol-3-phosphate acyltransferase